VLGTLLLMAERGVHGTRRRRVARVLVATYYEAELAGLPSTSRNVECYRADELDVHAVDEVIHHYKKAARDFGNSVSSAVLALHQTVAATLGV
jgi:hypothetical protein